MKINLKRRCLNDLCQSEGVDRDNECFLQSLILCAHVKRTQKLHDTGIVTSLNLLM